MSKLKSIATTLSVVVAIAISAPIAMAQDILVIDPQAVLQKSKAGQDLSAKVKQISESMQAELTPEQTALKSEKAALDQKLTGKTREQVQADTALVTQGQAYTRKVQTYAAKTDKRAQELVRTENNALNTFYQKMSDAVEKVRVSKGAKIVLANQNVFLSDPAVDVTDAVVKQLDQDTPTIAVTRVTLPDQPAPQR